MKFVQPIRDEKTIEDLRHYFKMQGYRNLVLYECGIYLGLRISDILRLRKQDIIGKKYFEIRTDKNGKPVRVEIHPTLRRSVEEYTKFMEDEDFLFPSRKGKNQPITRQQAWKILNEAAEKLNLEFRFSGHSLRKTMGYWIYRNTGQIEILRLIFNHSRESVTRLYLGIEDDQISEAIHGLPY